MKFQPTKRLVRSTALIVTGIVLGSATIALANADESAPTLIHSCVNPASGEMKIVSGPSDCAKNEQYLSWNQQGPQGRPDHRDHKASKATIQERLVIQDLLEIRDLQDDPVQLVQPQRLLF